MLREQSGAAPAVRAVLQLHPRMMSKKDKSCFCDDRPRVWMFTRLSPAQPFTLLFVFGPCHVMSSGGHNDKV